MVCDCKVLLFALAYTHAIKRQRHVCDKPPIWTDIQYINGICMWRSWAAPHQHHSTRILTCCCGERSSLMAVSHIVFVWLILFIIIHTHMRNILYISYIYTQTYVRFCESFIVIFVLDLFCIRKRLCEWSRFNFNNSDGIYIYLKKKI